MRILGIGGTTRAGSTSETALRTALEGAQAAGAETECLAGADLAVPFYDPATSERTREARRLVDGLRAADGLVFASPGYHGTVSGLVKNALDYAEDLREEHPPYLEDRAVGCVTVAHGWQAAVTTLRALRDISHALRGWPTPYGAAVNVTSKPFEDGACTDDVVREQLHLVGVQVVEFTARRRGEQR